MCPVELGVRGVSKPKGRKPHLLQTSRAQPCIPQRPPECLAVRWQVTLATGGNGNKHNMVLQQLFLPNINLYPLHLAT
jgi:hypothetical protein